VLRVSGKTAGKLPSEHHPQPASGKSVVGARPEVAKPNFERIHSRREEVMKNLTTFTSLAITFSLLASCRQNVHHDEDSTHEKSPAPIVNRPHEDEGASTHDDGVRHGAGRGSADDAVMDRDRSERDRKAEADIEPAQGVTLKGEVELKETADGVRIVAEVEEGSPGLHAFHIHEKGDCSDLPGRSMGDHFNPDGKPHKLPQEGEARHLGDLGNIEIGDDGKGKVKITVKGASLKEGDARSLLGKSFVVHERKDKGKEDQPAGDSGDPIACGVIKKD
jgi:superoxide dismutase, Cu-Zn family